MNQKHTFNLDGGFLSGYDSLFIKLVLVIIGVYLVVMVINFLRDKFINTETNKEKEDISDLLILLSKLFFISGFGFVVANILQVIFSEISNNHNLNFRGEWGYLTFGVIVIFVGWGFKLGYKILKKDKAE